MMFLGLSLTQHRQGYGSRTIQSRMAFPAPFRTTQLTVNNGSIIAVAGLFPVVNITGAEATTDTLTINALGGNDMFDASNLAHNLIGLTDRRRRGRHTGRRRRGRRIDRRTGSGRALRRSRRQHPDPGLSRICSQCVRNLRDDNSRSKVSGI